MCIEMKLWKIGLNLFYIQTDIEKKDCKSQKTQLVSYLYFQTQFVFLKVCIRIYINILQG
jgi:hypothetical protein